jgi:hypothetical protein
MKFFYKTFKQDETFGIIIEDNISENTERRMPDMHDIIRFDGI